MASDTYPVEVYSCEVYPPDIFIEEVYGDRCGEDEPESNISSIDDLGEGLYAVNTLAHGLEGGETVQITGTQDGIHDGIFIVNPIDDPNRFIINSSGAATGPGGMWVLVP